MIHAPKRILFLLPSLKRAGAEAQLVALADNLDPVLFSPYLLTFLDYQDLRSELRNGAVRLLFIPRRNSLDIGLIRKIANIIEEKEIDLVHCTMQYCNLIGSLASRFSRRHPPVVGAIHTTKNVNLKNELADRLVYNRVMRGNKWTIFVSTNQRDYWLTRFPFLKPCSSVIHNGVDWRDLNPSTVDERSAENVRAQLKIGNNDRVIACIAGFRPEKGHRILINAFARVHKENPHALLVLAGTGPLQAEMTGYAEKIGVRDRIRIPGQIDYVKALLAVSAITVLSSTAVETLSMAMLESMAMAVPMISTLVGGANEVIQDGVNGFTVKPGDEAELATKISKCLSDERLRLHMACRARKTIKENFSREKMIAETSELLLRLVKS